MKTKERGTRRTQRMRKLHCVECGYIIYVSRQWVMSGIPACPNHDCADHGRELAFADPADAIEAGTMSLDDLPRVVRTEVCRRNGWQDAIIRTSPGPRGGTKQCKARGCSTFVKRGELYCGDHQHLDMPF